MRVLAVASALALLLAAGCDGQASGDPSPTSSPSSAPPAPVDLTFGVYGSADEVAAHASVAQRFDDRSADVGVEIESWANHEAAMAAFGSGEDVPDVFLASSQDLLRLRAQELIQPVGDLLDERGVQFGDGFSRESVLAFSQDNALQCLPYGISPMVVYYNTELVDFERMAARGLDAPDPLDLRWSFEQFTAAAEFATRPRRGTRGVHVEPTLTGLSPFVYSGDGQMFDDEGEPTSLAFSSEETRSALEVTLPLLRNPIVTLTQAQLAADPAIEWFKRGRLGMLVGFRDLVPQLREVEGLAFDVMPMPVLEDAATVGDIAGMCLSADTDDAARAADFLVHLSSAASVGEVAATGYLVPASLVVAESGVFLQQFQQPRSATVFNTTLRSLVLSPPLADPAALEAAVAPGLRRMLTVPVLDLEAVTEQIDEASRTVLSPDSASPAPQ